MNGFLAILLLLVPVLLVVWLGYVVYAFIWKGEKPPFSRVAAAILIILPLVMFLGIFADDVTTLLQDNATQAREEGNSLADAIKDSGF